MAITQQVTKPLVSAALTQVKHLPPLSPTASRLLEATADPEIEIDDLAGIIFQDPALSARILGVANSAYFGQSQPINSVREAIIKVLGLNLVKSLAVSIALAGAFDPRACRGFDLAGYWYSSLATASLSRLLAMQHSGTHRPDADSSYLCGLLHNLGHLLLAHVFPQQLSTAIAECKQSPDQGLRALERRHLGIDQLQAGEWLARRWHLPEAVADVIGNLDDAEYQGPHALQRDIVSGACVWIGAVAGNDGQEMTEDARLQSLQGIGSESLLRVEQQFRSQCESLRSTARVLIA